jgi:CO/xanthine dehydrogenase Mo-binding subunit
MITPVMIPALVNALYDASGIRVRELPLRKQGLELSA